MISNLVEDSKCFPGFGRCQFCQSTCPHLLALYGNCDSMGFTSTATINSEEIVAVFWSSISGLHITLLKLFVQAVTDSERHFYNYFHVFFVVTETVRTCWYKEVWDTLNCENVHELIYREASTDPIRHGFPDSSLGNPNAGSSNTSERCFTSDHWNQCTEKYSEVASHCNLM